MHNIDPYRRWLGILTTARPLTAYQLLEISENEDDVWLIESAAELKRDALLREKRNIPPDVLQRLLRELAEAVVILSNPDRRILYDRRLNEIAEARSESALRDRELDEGIWRGQPEGSRSNSRRSDSGLHGIGPMHRDGDHRQAPTAEVDSDAADDPNAPRCSQCATKMMPGQRYCGKCGSAILQDCPACEKQTPVHEHFCIHCGVDIEEQIRQHLMPIVEARQEAEAAVEERNFKKATEIAEIALQAVVPRNQRIVEIRDQLQARTEYYREQLEIVNQAAETIREEAKQALERREHELVVKRVRSLPEFLIVGQLKSRYEEAVEALRVKRDLKQKAAAAYKQRRFLEAIEIIHKIENEFIPDKDTEHVRAHAEAALLKVAVAHVTKGHYEDALVASRGLVRLAVGPNQEYDDLLKKVETLARIAWDVHNAPHVDEVVVSLAKWLVSNVPGDQRTKEMLNDLQRRLEKKRQSGSGKVIPWVLTETDILTSDAQWAFALGRVELANAKTQELMASHPGEWTVAFGLSLAGHGLHAVDINLREKIGPKSTVLRLADKLRQQKSTGAVWGLDLGAYSVHAVRLLLDQEKGRLQIDDAFQARHRVAISRLTEDAEQAEVVAETLAKLAPCVRPGDHVVLNCSGAGTTQRVVPLPSILPTERDKLVKLVENEIRFQMPFGVEMLDWDWHIVFESGKDQAQKEGGAEGPRSQAADNESSKENQAKEPREDTSQTDAPLEDLVEQPESASVIAAARKELVDQRIQWLSDAGIRIHRIQPDAIAALNALIWQHGRPKKTEDGYSVDLPKKPVAMIDVGHAQSTFVAANQDRVWIRTISVAGNDFLQALVGAFNLTRGDAEKLLASPPTNVKYAKWQEALNEPFGRLLAEIDKSIHRCGNELETGGERLNIFFSGRSMQVHGLWRFLRTGR